MTGSKRGYDLDEVEEFLGEARRAYNGEVTSTPVTSQSIRRVAFRMRRGGYAPAEVDAALERLEDAFAARERETARCGTTGSRRSFGQARSTAQVVLDRTVRPRGQRFRRAGILTPGYSVAEVDAVADRVAEYIQNGAELDLTALREVAFTMQRGGYQEAQVDRFSRHRRRGDARSPVAPSDHRRRVRHAGRRGAR